MQLKMKFLVGYNMKTYVVPGIDLWWWLTSGGGGLSPSHFPGRENAANICEV